MSILESDAGSGDVWVVFDRLLNASVMLLVLRGVLTEFEPHVDESRSRLNEDLSNQN